MLRTYLVYNTVVGLCQFFCCDGKVLLRPEKKVLVLCLAGARSLLGPEKKSSSRLSGGLCGCVSFWFWQKIGFSCTYYYVLGVPYSCGVVLFFLVLAGNSF